MQITLELPTPHEKQQYLLNNRKRFNVLKCGRRFGKTELCQELILEAFEQGNYVGYFSPTYKDLYEVWKTTLNNFHNVIATKSETVKQVVFINGAKVDFWSMEEPNSGRGRKYHRVLIDECEKAGKLKEAIWLWDLAEDRFAQALKTLDFHHARDHLWAVANCLHGQDTPEARAWVRPLCQSLRKGRENEWCVNWRSCWSANRNQHPKNRN